MPEASGLRSTKKKPKRRYGKIISLVLLVLVLAIGGYGYSVYQKAKDTVNEKMNIDLSSIDLDQAREKLGGKEILNILLLGVDKRTGDRGRSDAIILLNLDPKDHQMTMVSIPRDTRAQIAGKGRFEKINHAYSYGGPNLSVATVEDLLDVEIDYYVELNMEGLADLVDAVGGITVQNELDWYGDDGFHYQKGTLHLNGQQTLGYVRMRKKDPAGDFGRTKRQREVIDAIIKKGASVATVTKLHGLIDVLGNNMVTNMTFADMQGLLRNYRNVANQVTEYMLEGKGTSIGGVYYYSVSDEELEKVHQMLTS